MLKVSINSNEFITRERRTFGR